MDKWEIQRDHILLFKDKKLGCGAFAVVYKAEMLCKNPLIEHICRHRLISLESSDCNEVAVKRIRNTLNETDR